MLRTALLISVLMPMPSIVQSKVQTTKQIECLANNIYHESKGEPYKGKLGVAFVTINRTKSNSFPSDICSVVYQKNKNSYQFSWVRSKKHSKIDNDLYDDILDLAENVYNKHETMQDPTNGSLYFHSTSVNPKWNKKKIVKIGRHIFYK